MIGDNGGEEGAGASASSSSSSPHSSSLRGVMLFPNQTEWIDTYRVYRIDIVSNDVPEAEYHIRKGKDYGLKINNKIHWII